MHACAEGQQTYIHMCAGLVPQVHHFPFHRQQIDIKAGGCQTT